MTKLKLFGAAAVVLSSALAGPAMAQQVVSHPGRCVQYDPGGNCQRYAAAIRGDRTAYRNVNRNSDNNWNNDNWNNGNWNNGWRDSRNDNRWQRRDSGFWPGDVAADAAGDAVATADAAVGTAGAIATAPFRGDSYAYDNDGGYNNGWNRQTYAQRNGFVCTPGTWFKGDDGRRHPCQ
jgi:hypothetical protein